MCVEAKIYEGVEGLLIDCLLYTSCKTPVDSTTIIACELRVLNPNNEESVWTATAESPNIVRHVVPNGADLVAGKYKIQPYIETASGFKGLWGPVQLTIHEKWK